MCGISHVAGLYELYSAIRRTTEATPRQFVRLKTLLSVRVSGHQWHDSAARVEYISELPENGIFVRTLYPRQANAVLPINIIIDCLVVKLKAVVVRSVTMSQGLFNEHGMDMKFVEISDEHRQLIRNFIDGQIMGASQCPGEKSVLPTPQGDYPWCFPHRVRSSRNRDFHKALSHPSRNADDHSPTAGRTRTARCKTLEFSYASMLKCHP